MINLDLSVHVKGVYKSTVDVSLDVTNQDVIMWVDDKFINKDEVKWLKTYLSFIFPEYNVVTRSGDEEVSYFSQRRVYFLQAFIHTKTYYIEYQQSTSHPQVKQIQDYVDQATRKVNTIIYLDNCKQLLSSDFVAIFSSQLNHYFSIFKT